MLTPDERASFESAFRASSYTSRSAMMRAACLAWARDTLAIAGTIPDPPPTPPGSLDGRKGLHAYLRDDDAERWLLAVERSKLSGYTAATTAVLRWLARRPSASTRS